LISSKRSASMMISSMLGPHATIAINAISPFDFNGPRSTFPEAVFFHDFRDLKISAHYPGNP
jgi:hypothetical protein